MKQEIQKGEKLKKQKKTLAAKMSANLYSTM